LININSPFGNGTLPRRGISMALVQNLARDDARRRQPNTTANGLARIGSCGVPSCLEGFEELLQHSIPSHKPPGVHVVVASASVSLEAEEEGLDAVPPPISRLPLRKPKRVQSPGVTSASVDEDQGSALHSHRAIDNRSENSDSREKAYKCFFRVDRPSEHGR